MQLVLIIKKGDRLHIIVDSFRFIYFHIWFITLKVVQYKQTTRMEEKKKKALDLHLSFIVDQTEKYSSWLTAGLQNTDGSRTSSLASDAEGSMDSGEGESLHH